MTKKFWAKKDEMLLSDIKLDSAPQDPFKSVHVKNEKKNEVSEKVTLT